MWFLSFFPSLEPVAWDGFGLLKEDDAGTLGGLVFQS